MEWTCHLDQADLQAYMKKVFGADYALSCVRRMHGGAQKVVYKLDCHNGFSCVLYVWDLTQNFFQAERTNEDYNEQSYGGDLFALNNHYLTQLGISTPALYDLNRERTRYPFDYALVEFIEGDKAEVYFEHPDRRVQDQLFQRLGDMLAVMHAHQSHSYGKPYFNGVPTQSCHRMKMKSVFDQLSYAAQHIASFEANHSQLRDQLYTLESRIEPRDRYGFIHGELGPDHVFVNERLEPYLIDIEGAMFFDIEQEHSFLELRFGDHYRYLRNEKLDLNRMRFYRFAHHLSLTAGGLKLLHRGFPDRVFAKELAAYHAQCVMRWMEEGGQF